MQEPIARAPGHAGLIFILAVAAFASTYASRTAEPLVGVIARDLASTPDTIALVTAVFALPYAMVQPVLGPVGDTLGKERVMKVSLAVLAATLAVSAFVTDSATLLALRFLSGAAAGGIIPAGVATIGDRVALERRQVALSRFIMAVVIGQLCGSSVSGILAEVIGWRGVFILASAVAVAGWLAVTARFPSAPPPSSGLSVADAAARYRAILAIPRARALYAFVFIEAVTIYGVFPFIAPVFEERGLGGPLEAGVALAAFGLGGLLFALGVSVMVRLPLPRMLVGGGIVVGLSLLTLPIAPDWRVEVAAMLAAGFGFYMLHNPFQTQVTEVAPHSRASAVSLHALSFFGGQALGVVVIGFGLRTVGFLATMALCALAIFATGLVAARVLAVPLAPDQPRPR